MRALTTVFRLSGHGIHSATYPSPFLTTLCITLQIEGGYDADGKGPSIWDTWTEVEGAIADGSDGKVACDSYSNYEEDARIISEMGATHYRQHKIQDHHY